MAPRRRALPGHHPGIDRQFPQFHLGARGERMRLAGDQHQRVVEEQALLDVADGCRIAQRPDQEVDLAPP